MKAIDFEKYLDAQLKNAEFRKAYDGLAEQYGLAKQVIRYRSERNLSQAQLAKLVGTSQPAIARLESGNHSNLTLGFLSRLAEALDLRAELRFLPLRPARASSAAGRRKGSRESATVRSARA